MCTRFTRFGHAAHVIDVVVSHEQMIDLRDAGVAHGGLNAIGVPAIVIRPARIDQQRCARGRNQQRRLASFDIDGVDGEAAWMRPGHGCASGRAGDQREHAQSGKQEVFQNRQSVSRTAHGAKPAASPETWDGSSPNRPTAKIES